MGPLVRFLLILFAIYLAWRFLRKLLAPDSRNKRLPDAADMVRCSLCGVYVPQSEAFRLAEKSYCSQQHLQADTND